MRENGLTQTTWGEDWDDVAVEEEIGCDWPEWLFGHARQSCPVFLHTLQ